jgi:hypothetical protein
LLLEAGLDGEDTLGHVRPAGVQLAEQVAGVLQQGSDLFLAARREPGAATEVLAGERLAVIESKRNPSGRRRRQRSTLPKCEPPLA